MAVYNVRITITVDGKDDDLDYGEELHTAMTKLETEVQNHETWEKEAKVCYQILD